MSRFANEPTIRMPPRSTAVLEKIGDGIIGQLCPNVLERPTPFPVLKVFEDILPNYRIHTYAVSEAELPDQEAVTDHEGKDGDDIFIRIRDESYAQLVDGGPRAHRVRATLPHELGHAVAHVPVLRRRLNHPKTPKSLLQRHRSADIPTYEQSEWQAWVLGGSVLMPVRTLKMLPQINVESVARIYEVSPLMAKAHLGRMRRARLID